MADKKQFSNTKSIVKVETGIVTLISYRHYLKIVGNNNLSYDQICKKNENFNLLPYVEWDRFVTLTGAQAEYVIVSTMLYIKFRTLPSLVPYNNVVHSVLYGVYILLAVGRWFSPSTRVSSNKKTDLHDITDILLKVTLIPLTLTIEAGRIFEPKC